MVNSAIDEGDGAGGVGEDGWPVREGEIGGEDEALDFVPAGDHLEEQVGVAGVVRDVADFVDAQDPDAAVGLEPAVEGAGGITAAEIEEQLGGGGKESGLAGEDGQTR